MNSSNNTPESDNRERRLTWVPIAIAAVLFGLGMAMLGYFVGQTGRAANDDLPTVAAAVSTVVPQEPTEAPTEVADAAPSSASAIESSAAQPVEQPPTATPVPTDTPAEPEPTATSEPTAVVPGVSPLQSAEFTTLLEVWELIAEQYDGEMPPSNEVIDAAIEGSLNTLDDNYTRYAPPNVAERMREEMGGSVQGIGAYVQENDDGWVEIVRPIDGQPADLVGLKAGDVILAIDGVSVEGESLDEVVLKVRGPEGTVVNLTIGRAGEEAPLEFSITRTRYVVPVVESEILPAEIAGDDKIGYLWLTEFNRNAETLVLEALQALQAEGAESFIFDLRDNPGGFLDQAVAVGDIFLGDGVLLYERNRNGLDETFSTADGDFGEELKIVVLVNEGSASASEIVAGAMQDRGRATLIGATTFGKGSVQLINTLSDGSELRVTTARWYTPDNRTIDGQGVEPDIIVETPEDLRGVDDGQLLRAVEFLQTGQ